MGEDAKNAIFRYFLSLYIESLSVCELVTSKTHSEVSNCEKS